MASIFPAPGNALLPDDAALAPARALADLPPRALRLVRRAEAWLKRGEPGFAEQVLEQALALTPDHRELVRLRALVLHAQKRYDETIALLHQAIARQPGDQRLYNNLGSALAESGDMPAAVEAFRKACDVDPAEAVSWFNLGKALDSLQRADEAERALVQALGCRPDYVEALVTHAETLRTMGRIDEAVAEFRRALRLEPDAVEAWSDLFGLKAIKPTEEDLAVLERLYRRGHANDDKRASIAYVYGMALESSGRHADAYAMFVNANAIKRRGLVWDAAGFSGFVDSVLATFAGTVGTAADETMGSGAILLMGMPRSGSTLTKQILSAHAEVEGLGEIGELANVLREESARRRTAFPAWAVEATPEDWARLGANYLERAGNRRTGKARMVTDKSLSNWQLVGAARAMLPGAHFIDCRRDPLETCWSAFKHQFGDQQPFSCEFAELASWWRDYDRATAFWNQRYPGLVYRQDYEAMILEPEARIRHLLEHCGLQFDPACLRFHESRRDVRTASAAQVRQPLQSNTARAERYGALLDPLRAALGL
jgi:tetratricopeptide (TPR) repeat protein